MGQIAGWHFERHTDSQDFDDFDSFMNYMRGLPQGPAGSVEQRLSKRLDQGRLLLPAARSRSSAQITGDGIVRAYDPAGRYVIEVDVFWTGDSWACCGVAARALAPIKRSRETARFTAEVARRRVFPRDVRRLPLTAIVEGALAFMRDQDPLENMKAPRGRPDRGTDFYREHAQAYRAFQAAGLSPAKEIARRKGVHRNLVDQWTYRARRLGFLDQSTRHQPTDGVKGGANDGSPRKASR